MTKFYSNGASIILKGDEGNFNTCVAVVSEYMDDQDAAAITLAKMSQTYHSRFLTSSTEQKR